MLKSFTTLLVASDYGDTLRAAIDGDLEFPNLDILHQARDPLVSQWRTVGLAKVEIEFTNAMSYERDNAHMLLVDIRERILPGNVIREHMSKEVARLVEVQGRQLSRREKAQVRENVEATLLPKAFIRKTQIPVYLIRSNNAHYLVIASTSAKVVDDIVVLLREALKVEFPYSYLVEEDKVTPFLRKVLSGDSCFSEDDLEPDYFSAQFSGKFKGADRQVTVKNVDLHSETVDRLLTDGFKPIEMGMTFGDAMSFKITPKGHINGLKLLDITHAFDDVDETNAADMFHATFVLYIGAARKLLDRLRAAMLTFKTDVLADEPAPEKPLKPVVKSTRLKNTEYYFYHAESDSVFAVVGLEAYEEFIDTPDGAMCEEINKDVYEEHLARLKSESQSAAPAEDDDDDDEL